MLAAREEVLVSEAVAEGWEFAGLEVSVEGWDGWKRVDGEAY